MISGCGKDDSLPAEETIVEEEQAEPAEEETPVEEEAPVEEPVEEEEPVVEEEPAEEEETDVEEESAEEEEPEEEEQAAVEAESFVIYDAEGVQVVLENVKFDDSGSSAAMLSLTNNNPDNKKASFRLRECAFNGVYVDLSDSREAKAGETNNAEINIRSAVNKYNEVMEKLSETIETVPVETVDCYYEIRIGSESEWVKDKISFETAQYNGRAYEKAYGEKIYEGEVGAATLEVHGKEFEGGNTIIVKNTSDVDIRSWGVELTCKGKSLSVRTYNGNYDGSLRSGEALFAYFDKTAQDLRADYEIPNDEPLDLQMKFTNYDNSRNEVFIPIEISE